MTVAKVLTRRRWLPLALLLVGIGVFAAGAYVRLRPAPRALVGSVVQGQQAAPDFELVDQLGKRQRLTSFRGKPAALTFIYTNCPDVCPLIAANMHIVHKQLGNDAEKVELLAITVDPERDTVEQIRGFSDVRQLTNEWHFMTGSRPQLERVWKSYGILTQGVTAEGTPVPAPSPDSATGAATAGTLLSPAFVEHSAPVFLIDKRGFVRVVLPPSFEADDLLTNLRTLLAE